MHKGSRSGKWLRKAGGLFPPTPFRARRAVSVTSVVQNAVLYIGIENAFWVKKPCRKAKDSFNGLKRKSALDRHAVVHWMDMTTSIRLKFMCPSDGRSRFNPIENRMSIGWTQRPFLAREICRAGRQRGKQDRESTEIKPSVQFRALYGLI